MGCQRVQRFPCPRSLYAFIAFRPTCYARRLVMRNIHETFPQSFKFSEINENISFLSSLVNARKITVFQRLYACGEHARTRVRGHYEQRATQSYI